MYDIWDISTLYNRFFLTTGKNQMSNNIYFQATKFDATQFDDVAGKITYGYRAWDNYCQTYCDSWDCIPTDNLLFFKRICDEYTNIVRCTFDNVRVIDGLLEWIKQEKHEVFINGVLYTFEQIKSLMENI